MKYKKPDYKSYKYERDLPLSNEILKLLEEYEEICFENCNFNHPIDDLPYPLNDGLFFENRLDL